MKKNKAMTAIQVIILFAVGIVTAFILIAVFSGQIGKSNQQAKGLLSSSSDYDGDGVADFFDKCACGTASGLQEFSGCESEQQLKSQTQKDKNDCNEKIQKANSGSQ